MTKVHITPASLADNEAIQEGLTDYNIKTITALPRAEIIKLNYALKDGNELVGGHQR